jgi:hypothetical protein
MHRNSHQIKLRASGFCRAIAGKNLCLSPKTGGKGGMSVFPEKSMPENPQNHALEPARLSRQQQMDFRKAWNPLRHDRLPRSDGNGSLGVYDLGE